MSRNYEKYGNHKNLGVLLKSSSTMTRHFIFLFVAVAGLTCSSLNAAILELGSSGSGGLAGTFFATTPVREFTPASVVFGFLGLLVAVSSRWFLARRSAGARK